MPSIPRSTLLRYSIALVSVALATLLRFSLTPVLGNQAPFFTYIIATMVTAWAGGFGPALLGIILGALVSAYFFVAPFRSPSVSIKSNILNFSLYLVISLIAALLSREMHKARQRAEALARIVASSDDAIFGKMFAVANDYFFDFFKRAGIDAHAPRGYWIAAIGALLGELHGLAVLEN